MWANIILSPRQISCIATGTFWGHEIIRQRNVSSTKVLKMESGREAHCEHPELLWPSFVEQILMYEMESCAWSSVDLIIIRSTEACACVGVCWRVWEFELSLLCDFFLDSQGSNYGSILFVIGAEFHHYISKAFYDCIQRSQEMSLILIIGTSAF